MKTYQITLSQQIQEVEAEIAFRQSFYGVQVRAGKMRREIADEKLAKMRAVLVTLQQVEIWTIERFGLPGDSSARIFAQPRKVNQAEDLP